MKKMFIFGAIFLLSTQLFANDSLKAKVTELVNLEGNLNKVISKSFVDSLSKNEELKKNVVDMDKYMEITKNFMENKNMEKEIKEKTIEILSEVYTEKEVDALLKFKNSPEAKSVQEKQAKIIEKTLPAMMEITTKYTEQYTKDLIASNAIKEIK